MNRLDFTAINAALDPSTVVPQWLPDGHKRNNEWVARNPTRNDNNPGSFTINLRSGRWKDFAGGYDDSGKDLISLYAYLFHNNDQGAAARELAQNHGVKMDAATREAAANKVRQIEEQRPQLVLPVPDDAAAASFKHRDWGDPSRVWHYRDAKGRTLLYVCRFDPAGERKQIIPRSYCRKPDGSFSWMWRGITGKDKRPLYGLDRLQANPEADAIVVEGEKAADAGQQLFGDAAVVTTWLGGVETADRVSVGALAGRRVILWPDFDAQTHKQTGDLLPLHEQPGMRAMMALATALKGVAREIVMVGYVPDVALHGWDLADALDDGFQLADVMKYMGEHAGDPWHIAATPATTPSTTPANDNAPQVPLDATVNPFGFPHLSDKGQPLNTVENLSYLLMEYGITARYNIIRKTVEVAIPGRKYSADNRANAALAELTSLCARNRMPQSMLADYIKLISDSNAYNPVCDWIESKPWDGISRLQALFDTVQTRGSKQLRDTLMLRWLVSAVASVFMEHGFESHGVLVFTGDQGQGKTKWIKRLLPPALQDVILVGAVLDPNNKDTVTNAISHWLVELGELDATFRKADIARLKSFVTNSTDKVRRPYDRIESEYQRRTVFFASVNEERYLVDDTGNRRWWTVPVSVIDYEHDIDMQQVWAELLAMHRAGERHYLDGNEMKGLNDTNAEHEAIDPIEEQILRAFDWDQGELVGYKEMTATEVLLAIGYDKPNKSAATHASKVLKKLTGADPVRRNNGRFFSMPGQLKAARKQYADDDGRPF